MIIEYLALHRGHAKLLQSCLTLCDPMNSNPPGSSVHENPQAKILSELACPSPGNLPNPGIEPATLMSPILAGRFFTTSATWETPTHRVGDSNFFFNSNYLFMPKVKIYFSSVQHVVLC